MEKAYNKEDSEKIVNAMKEYCKDKKAKMTVRLNDDNYKIIKDYDVNILEIFSVINPSVGVITQRIASRFAKFEPYYSSHIIGREEDINELEQILELNTEEVKQKN